MKERNVYFGFWRISGGKRGEASGIYRILLILLLLSGSGMCGAAGEVNVSQYDVDIPALNAAEALNRLAKQTGAIFLFPYDLASSRQANPVKGRYTLSDALKLLLQGSGLSGGLSDKGVITISSVGEEERNSEEMTMLDDNKKASMFAKIATVLIAAFASSPDTYAQQDKGNKSTILEELVVTATRRSTDLQTANISASVLTGDGAGKALT